MLDVHSPHEPVHGWRDFCVHLCVITVGLFIALSLESGVEWIHHRHEVAETREALRRERDDNRTRFAQDTVYLRREAAMLENDLLVLRYLQQHSGAPEASLPGVLVLESSYARMNDAAWKTAQSTAVTALMPQEEVRNASELYSFFERIDRAHEEEADAIAELVGLTSLEPDPSRLKPEEIDETLTLVRHVFAKHLRHGFLMQNLSEEYPEFQPAPSRAELENWLHLSLPADAPDLQRATELTRKRIEASSSQGHP